MSKAFIKYPECGQPILATIATDTTTTYHFYHQECHCKGFIDEKDVELIPAISIKQPWAWLIVNGYKDLENRSTLKNFRGDVLICASKQWDKNWLSLDMWDNPFFSDIFSDMAFADLFDNLDKGGIIGAVTITDSITKSDSPWFIGPNAFVLTNPIKLTFTPCKGFLGFFNPKIN